MGDTNQNYLTHPKGIMSWLLTLDHKRIGFRTFSILFETLNNIHVV